MSYQAHTEAAMHQQSSAIAKSGKRWTSLAMIFVVLGSSAAFAQGVDTEKLRGLIETEKNAGRVRTIHVVEAYHAVGITSAHPRVELARAWGESFCAHASRSFAWDRPWTLMVYIHQHEQPAYSCQIPTMPNRFNIY
jgi:hypothetical protein